MFKSKVIGITGPTGAGKSMSCSILKKSGIAVIDSDKVARQVLDTDNDCKKLLICAFSDEIIMDDGSINREVLTEKAFSKNQMTKILNNITHPFIVKRIKFLVEECKSKKERTIIIDAPLLIESNLDKICDEIWSVIAPRDVRIQRIINRDNISYQKAIQRVNSQNNDNFYAEKSNIVIDGSLSIKSLNMILMGLIEKHDNTIC